MAMEVELDKRNAESNHQLEQEKKKEKTLHQIEIGYKIFSVMIGRRFNVVVDVGVGVGSLNEILTASKWICRSQMWILWNRLSLLIFHWYFDGLTPLSWAKTQMTTPVWACFVLFAFCGLCVENLLIAINFFFHLNESLSCQKYGIHVSWSKMVWVSCRLRGVTCDDHAQ